ncbi:protein of unknown function (plasmid) [Rhodovastum atsumiense]|nr:protein of unknown function [Rhodovastum atsumiense]
MRNQRPRAEKRNLVCEQCHDMAPVGTPGWYVDPEGIELCPGCEEDLWLSWKLEGFSR